MVPHRIVSHWLAFTTLLILAGCGEESYPQDEWLKRHPIPTLAPLGPVPIDPPHGPACVPVRSSESLPARLVATSSAAPATQRTIFVSDLFSLFKSNCGGCHVDGSSGNPPFHVTPLDFATKVDQSVLDTIRTSDPDKTMPPISNAGGKLYSQRTAGDPVLELANLLQQWIDAGRPGNVFFPPADKQSGVSPYVLSIDAGDHMTNLGSCIPSKEIVGSEVKKSEELDTFFASLQKAPPGSLPAERLGLPEHLEETDLFTLDTETLARHGVIAFVPAYPLWSDNAGKLRYIRVPRGQSIRFDKQTQRFDIPPNTRFYKTFLKKIIDVDGVVSYKKVETRLIVARPDIDHEDGTHEVTALFGTYVWNDDETKATLLVDPLRDGEPFRDRLLTIVTDEPLGQEVRAAKPKDLTAAYERVGAIRRYAIPGRDRCIQCHEGSATQDFALGFLPVQINRHPKGESGVIEETGPDELTQFQRLIDYGIITGVDSPADVLPLESTQGARKPRNEHELVAQGYMLGNCSHCHNPRGFPTMTAPILAGVLDFLPSSEGGIFEFSLEKTSPRIFRGINNEIPIPYITPSLMDLAPTAGPANKWDFAGNGNNDSLGFDYVLLAPWRSLIFRNVDTPFAYSDDNALFPHMPMNTPGFDCRAPRILGDWMVSIPSVWKNPRTLEFAAKTGKIIDNHPVCVPPDPDAVDTSPQPYAEVRRGEDGYDTALAEAEHRLGLYHSGQMDTPAARTFGRYDFCPDTSDIIDPAVLRDPIKRPVPTASEVDDFSVDPPAVIMPSASEPSRPHWVVTDPTEVQGDWAPRRADWKTILVDQFFPPLTSEEISNTNERLRAQEKQTREKGLVALLQTVKVASIQTYATTELPYGFWKPNPSCNFSKIPTVHPVSWYPEAARPNWMRSAPADKPVYTQLPGEAIYNMICVNCHGTNLDSLGRQADNLMLMTGGNARVANFRFGLFGPQSTPGSNRERVFGSSETVTADDMGARYMAWMALGGTAQTIPYSILNIVANTDVLGVKRTWNAPISSANMLDVAKKLCSQLLNVGNPEAEFDPDNPYPTGALIKENGDGDLWPKLCSMDNPMPLRAVYPRVLETGEVKKLFMRPPFDFYPTDKYPKDAPVVLGGTGKVVSGITPDNPAPWCIRKPGPAHKAAVDAYLGTHLLKGERMPYCPTSVVPASDALYPTLDDGHISTSLTDTDDLANLWATRGAINAGLAVFLFLNEVTAKGYVPQPRYDRCDLLPAH